MRDYLTGLLLPGKRKCIEPIAARINPSHVCAWHQSLHHFISVAAWSDQAILRAIRLAALPAIALFGRVTVPTPRDAGAGLPQNTFLWTGRVDHTFSDKTSMFGRYAYERIEGLVGTNSFSPYEGFTTDAAAATRT
jgi:hypothetical protein